MDIITQALLAVLFEVFIGLIIGMIIVWVVYLSSKNFKEWINE